MVEKMHSMGPTGRQNSVLQHEGPMDLRVYSELHSSLGAEVEACLRSCACG